MTEDFDGTEAKGGWPYGRKGSPGDYHRRKGEPAKPVRRVSAHQRKPMYYVASVDGDESVDLFRDKDGRFQVHTRDAVYDLKDVVGGKVVINIGTLGSLNVLAKAGLLPGWAERAVSKTVADLMGGSRLYKANSVLVLRNDLSPGPPADRLPMHYAENASGRLAYLVERPDGMFDVETRDGRRSLQSVLEPPDVHVHVNVDMSNVVDQVLRIKDRVDQQAAMADEIEKDEQSYSSLVTAPVGAQDQGLRILEEPEPPRSRSTRRPPAVPTGGDAQAEQPLYILRTGNNPLGKQGFTHQHDEWPRHPIRVEDHQAYFSEHADGGETQTAGAEQDTGAGPGAPESARGAAADAPGEVVFGGEADLEETCKKVFGRTPEEDEWSAIVGVPLDARVNVSTHGDEAIVRARWGHNSVVVVSYRSDKTAELNFIATTGEEKGTGAEIVRRIMRTAAELGFRRLELISIPKAKRFWEGMGFETVEGEDFEMEFDLAGYVGKRSGGRGGRTYLGPDEEAPEGVEVRQGKKGGRYYDKPGAKGPEAGEPEDDRSAWEKLGPERQKRLDDKRKRERVARDRDAETRGIKVPPPYDLVKWAAGGDTGREDIARMFKSGELRRSLTWTPLKTDSAISVADIRGHKVLLVFESSTEYKKVGRLRDPSGTRHEYQIRLFRMTPSSRQFSIDDVGLYSKVTRGESMDRQSAAKAQVDKAAKRQLGVDAPQFYTSNLYNKWDRIRKELGIGDEPDPDGPKGEEGAYRKLEPDEVRWHMVQAAKALEAAGFKRATFDPESMGGQYRGGTYRIYSGGKGSDYFHADIARRGADEARFREALEGAGFRARPMGSGFQVEESRNSKADKAEIMESPVYVKPGQPVPKGVEVQHGPRGGTFYDPQVSPSQAGHRVHIPRDLRDVVLGETPVCAYCGTSRGPFHADHIVPVKVGGRNVRINLQPACAACNEARGAKDPSRKLEWIRYGQKQMRDIMGQVLARPRVANMVKKVWGDELWLSSPSPYASALLKGARPIHLGPGDPVPEGAREVRGPRGGRYYVPARGDAGSEHDSRDTNNVKEPTQADTAEWARQDDERVAQVRRRAQELDDLVQRVWVGDWTRGRFAETVAGLPDDELSSLKGYVIPRAMQMVEGRKAKAALRGALETVESELGSREKSLIHGTPIGNLKAILKVGLLTDKGASNFSLSAPGVVYLSPETRDGRQLSLTVAAAAALVHGEDSFAVLRIRMPRRGLETDPKSFASGGMLTKHDVPPTAVVGYEVYDARDLKQMYEDAVAERDALCSQHNDDPKYCGDGPWVSLFVNRFDDYVQERGMPEPVREVDLTGRRKAAAGDIFLAPATGDTIRTLLGCLRNEGGGSGDLAQVGGLRKQGFTHEHDGWPRHPIGVKYHDKYFQEHGGWKIGMPSDEPDSPYGDESAEDELDRKVAGFIEEIAAGRWDKGATFAMGDDTLKALWLRLDLDLKTGRVQFTLDTRRARDQLKDQVMRRGLLPGTLSGEFYRAKKAVTDGTDWAMDKREAQKARLADDLGKAAFGGKSQFDRAADVAIAEAIAAGVLERTAHAGYHLYKYVSYAAVEPDESGAPSSPPHSRPIGGRWGVIRWMMDNSEGSVDKQRWVFEMEKAAEGDKTYALLADMMQLSKTGATGLRQDLSGLSYWLHAGGETAMSETLGAAAAGMIVKTWARSASDHQPLSIAVQKAAAAEFGMATDIDEWTGVAARDEARAFLKAHGDELRGFTRKVYDHTQRFLKKRGVEELTLARGWGWDPHETPEWFVDMVREVRHDAYWNGEPPAKPLGVRKAVQLNPMSSFSTEYEQAQAFATGRNGIVTMARVPISRVLSTFMTGFGCATENEVIVLGGELDAVHLAGSSESLPKDPDDAEDVLAEGGLRIGDAQEWPPQSPLFNAAEGPQAVPLDADAYDWPKRTRDYDLHQGDANDSIAGLDKHLPGRHDQEDHGNEHRLSDAHPALGKMTVGYGGDKRAATAKDWEKYEGEAKTRVEEWAAGGKYDRKMEPDEICYEGYRLRASARGRSDAWSWALWEAVQRFAASRGFSYMDEVTEDDVFADPRMPEPESIIDDDKVRERWQVAAHTADSRLTDYRNSNSAKTLLDFIRTESGGMWQRHCQRDLWNLARGAGGETVPVGKRGFGAERHFEEYRPFAEPGGLKGAKTWEEALDAEFTVYRGVVKGDEAENARRKPVVSYTTSPEIARLFAEGYYHSYNVPGQGKVYQRTCRLRDVLSYLNPDGELEVLLKPPGSKAEKAYGGYYTNGGIAFTHEHGGLPRHPAVLKDHAVLDKRSGGRGGKVFLGPGEKAPEGVEVHEGPRGGRWYQGGKAKEPEPEPKRSTTSRRVLEGKTPERTELEGETTFAQAGLRGGIWGSQTAIAECKPGVLPHVDGLSDTRLLHKMVPQDAITEFTVFRVFEALRPGFCPPVMLDDLPEKDDVVDSYYSDRPKGHSMRWVDEAGFGGTAMTYAQYLAHHEGHDAMTPAQAMDAGFMNTVDWLVSNQDRHTGNIIIDGDRLWPIDHGICSVESIPSGNYGVDYSFKSHLKGPKTLRAFRDSALAALKQIYDDADEVAWVMVSRGDTQKSERVKGVDLLPKSAEVMARSLRAATGRAAEDLNRWYRDELKYRREMRQEREARRR